MQRKLTVRCGLPAMLALLLAGGMAAQQSAPSPRKPRKVWTNDDLEALREKSGITVLQENRAAAAPVAGSEAQGPGAAVAPSAADNRDTPEQRMQNRIGSMRAELDKVNQEIRQIQRITTSGNTSGQGIDVLKVDAGLNTEARLAQLQERRKQLQAQIDAAEEEARRAGISPGVVR